MHAYPTEASNEVYSFKDNRLYVNQGPGNIHFLSPGDVAWKSDLETLHLLNQGLPSPCSLEAVVAKYLINEKRGNH